LSKKIKKQETNLKETAYVREPFSAKVVTIFQTLSATADTGSFGRKNKKKLMNI
jgi:hypothetical protein